MTLREQAVEAIAKPYCELSDGPCGPCVLLGRFALDALCDLLVEHADYIEYESFQRFGKLGEVDGMVAVLRGED